MDLNQALHPDDDDDDDDDDENEDDDDDENEDDDDDENEDKRYDNLVEFEAAKLRWLQSFHTNKLNQATQLKEINLYTDPPTKKRFSGSTISARGHVFFRELRPNPEPFKPQRILKILKGSHKHNHDHGRNHNHDNEPKFRNHLQMFSASASTSTSSLPMTPAGIAPPPPPPSTPPPLGRARKPTHPPVEKRELLGDFHTLLKCIIAPTKIGIAGYETEIGAAPRSAAESFGAFTQFWVLTRPPAPSHGRLVDGLRNETTVSDLASTFRDMDWNQKSYGSDELWDEFHHLSDDDDCNESNYGLPETPSHPPKGVILSSPRITKVPSKTQLPEELPPVDNTIPEDKSTSGTESTQIEILGSIINPYMATIWQNIIPSLRSTSHQKQFHFGSKTRSPDAQYKASVDGYQYAFPLTRTEHAKLFTNSRQPNHLDLKTFLDLEEYLILFEGKRDKRSPLRELGYIGAQTLVDQVRRQETAEVVALAYVNWALLLQRAVVMKTPQFQILISISNNELSFSIMEMSASWLRYIHNPESLVDPRPFTTNEKGKGKSDGSISVKDMLIVWEFGPARLDDVEDLKGVLLVLGMLASWASDGRDRCG